MRPVALLDAPPVIGSRGVIGRTICISHATGAQGTLVGRTVAERLGFQYVDNEVIAEAAEWGELDPAFVSVGLSSKARHRGFRPARPRAHSRATPTCAT
jgi:hypothetical protein